MGGKRRDYDGSFAMLDINFVLDDPRLDNLTATDRWVFLVLWCISVRERSEVLPTHYRLASVARLARVQPSTAKRALKKIMQNRLISIDGKNNITVVGVKKKHKNLKWKDAPINEDMGGNKNPIGDNKNKKKNTEEEKEIEEEGKPPKPPPEISFPENLDTPEFRATWDEWATYRKELRKKLTPSTAKGQIKKLGEHTAKDAAAMLEQSIMNGWAGIFPLKADQVQPSKARSDGLLETARRLEKEMDEEEKSL